MSYLSLDDRMAVMEMVSEIASDASQNPNLVRMMEFQEEQVEPSIAR